jgi:hypothetical protein
MRDWSIFGFLVLAITWPLGGAGGAAEPATCKIRVEPGHPWRPPFGLDRVGQPLRVAVETTVPQAPRDATLVAYVQGKEVGRFPLAFQGKPLVARATLESWPAEVAVVALAGAAGPSIELARLAVVPPAFEADAIARADAVVHPVDMGTILVPGGWLLLGPGAPASVELAAVSRGREIAAARAVAWYASAPKVKTDAPMPLAAGRRATVRLAAPAVPPAVDRDLLHVAIVNERGEELWQKTIPAMVVRQPPEWPRFGATETKLRYDAPISIRAADGALSSMKYEDGWAPHLRDVVVSLPNGARFVFWRGASYAPFWAGRHNTALCYEWAETSPPAGYTDCVEPLMDKELRYGRVQIVESTPARVHVRWTYQSCDFFYKVWGESAVEDFYFYPDGFGTRVLTVNSVPSTEYELSEFIILTPQATYPLSVLPAKLVDILFLDGQKREILFPFLESEQGEKRKPHPVPAVYRVRLNHDEALAAVSFCPQLSHLPATFFGPFFDRGQLVTPAYWGSHWPLARGKTTGWSIDDRIQLSPAHNSLMSWAHSRPEPLRVETRETLDTLGRPKTMAVRRWAWLIGMSDADDGRLLEWARSFARPPAVEIQGARLDFDAYVPERRAIRLVVEQRTVTVALRPEKRCVHPVFELSAAPRTLQSVELAGRALSAAEYAWDGRTLWLGVDVDQPSSLRLVFGDPTPR